MKNKNDFFLIVNISLMGLFFLSLISTSIVFFYKEYIVYSLLAIAVSIGLLLRATHFQFISNVIFVVWFFIFYIYIAPYVYHISIGKNLELSAIVTSKADAVWRTKRHPSIEFILKHDEIKSIYLDNVEPWEYDKVKIGDSVKLKAKVSNVVFTYDALEKL